MMIFTALSWKGTDLQSIKPTNTQNRLAHRFSII
jgi:hypothetical protein